MISALDELDSTVRCIEAGAEDYLPKPFNPVLLRARIEACLEKKRLLDELRVEKERSEALLLNMLPRRIVERMRQGETVIADHIAEATILFSDLVDFSSLAGKLSPEETVKLLGMLFSRFDALAADTASKRSRPSATAIWWRADFPRPERTTPLRQRRWRSRCSMPSRQSAEWLARRFSCASACIPAPSSLVSSAPTNSSTMFGAIPLTRPSAWKAMACPAMSMSPPRPGTLWSVLSVSSRAGRSTLKGKGLMETYFLYRNKYP